MPDTDTVHLGSGKVRELYALGDERLLLVASDRISTFDVVLPTEIPDKGRVLTGLAAFWFARTRSICPNHLLALRPDGRSTECRRLDDAADRVRGARLPRGLRLEGVPGSPARSAASSCRPACAVREAARADLHPRHQGAAATTRTSTSRAGRRLVGARALERARAPARIDVYRRGAEHALSRGIIIADTKFEFGARLRTAT